MHMHTRGYFPSVKKKTIQFRRWRCAACRGHERADHPGHLRKPGLCKFKPGTITRVWSCPGCLGNKRRDHPLHKLDHTCQWTLAPERLNARGPRDGQPRDPADRHAAGEDTATEGLRADMRDDAMAADDDATPKPPPRATPYVHPTDPPVVPEGLLKEYLDALYDAPVKQQIGWKPGYLDTDVTLVKSNTRFFQTCVPKHRVEDYPYRSVFTGTPAKWVQWENYVRYMDLPESVRKGPLKDRSFRLIHIFHQLPSPAEGGEHGGDRAILDGQPNSTGDGADDGGTETPRDRWEIRGDRVHRIIQVPRTKTCTPDSEPDPCPVGSERLTDRRVTVCKLVEGLTDEQVVIDTWRDAPADRQTRIMSKQLWQGEVIFEMTHEEKLRRGLHRSLTLDEEHRAGETAIVPADNDEEVRSIVPRKSQESRILRVDGAAQAEKRPEDWTGFDVGNALSRLRSDKEGVRMRALRQLHLRWFHATIEQMRKILAAAGVPKTVLDQISTVVHTCRICRRWERHSPKAATSVRLADHFNECCQLDLIEFTEDDQKYYIIHIIDEATRFSTGDIVLRKTPEDIFTVIYFSWIRTFGKMETLITDQEGAMTSHEATAFLARHGISLKLRPKNTKAWMVERHNEIVRQGMHRLYDSCVAASLAIPIRHRLCEVFFYKNALLQYGGFSPYNSVIGRQPTLLPNIEDTNLELADDRRTGTLMGISRGAAKLRELAINAIISATAYARTLRAEKTRTRGASQLQELKVGDLVDYWRNSLQKEESGWIGPATVTDIAAVRSESKVWVRYMDRAVLCRTIDVRPHLALLAFMCVLFTNNDPFDVVMDYLENMKPNTNLTLIAHRIFNRWELSKKAKHLRNLFEAVLFVGLAKFGITNCVGARLVRGRQHLMGLSVTDVTEAPIYYYTPPHRGNYHVYSLDNPMISVDLEEILPKRNNDHPGDDYCFIQFVGVSSEARREIVRQIPNIPNLAGQGSPDISTPRSTGTYDTNLTDVTDVNDMTFQETLGRPRLATSDLEMTSRKNPLIAEDRTASPGLKQSEDTPETQLYPVSQQLDLTTLSVPATTGWETWTSEEQRSNELFMWFKDLLPKTTDAPTQEEEAYSDAAQEAMENIRLLRRAPTQITHESYIAMVEARCTEPRSYFMTDNDSMNHEQPLDQNIDDDETVTIAYEGIMAYCHPFLHENKQMFTVDPTLQNPPTFEHTTVVVTETFFKKPYKSKSESKQSVTIEKELNNLTPDDVIKHKSAVTAADLKELTQLHDLGTFCRYCRRKAKNIIDVRWVRKWKKDPTTLEKFIKSRLTVRGFKDMCQDLETYAGTATRWAQRLIVALAVLLDLPMFTIDVTGAFAKGLNWEQLAELTGEQIREVQFELTKPEDIALLRQLPGFSDFDPAYEVLQMTKAIYGLKDAPRAWRKRLHQILVEAGMRQLKSEMELYVCNEALKGQPTTADNRSAPRGCLPVQGRPELAITAHVDDLKCIGNESSANKLISNIEKAVGKVTLLKDNFEHCGIKHETHAHAIIMHQNHYAAQLRPIDTKLLGDHKDEMEVKEFSPELQTLFMSLLGGLAWLVLTRVDICIYVQCMQRHTQNPRVEDIKKLNRLLVWVQKRPAGIVYHRYNDPKNRWRIQAVSDSAFRSLEDNTTGLALRGFIVILVIYDETTPGGKSLVLDYGTKKHKRVNRSTFAAELNAAVDTLDIATLVQFTLEEVFDHLVTDAQVMQVRYAGATLQFPVEVCIDAKAVFDAISATDFSMPAEATLVNHLHSIRELVRDGRLSCLWWVDTRDMVADGLNKGGLPRDPIMHLCEKGHWSLEHPAIAYCPVR